MAEREQKCWHCGVIFENDDDEVFHFCRDLQEDDERDFDWNDYDANDGTEG